MIKRLFDLIASGVILALFFPFYGLIAAWIKLDSRGPVHHRAFRTGRNGELFTLFKFRTMTVDAALNGPGITKAGDSRVTRAGRVLRITKIDEIPQLLNVLKGDMSLVGPRPEDPKYVEIYTPEQRRVLKVRPGLSSPASIKYRNEEEMLIRAGGNIEEVYVHEILPDKLRLDLDYIENQTFVGDLEICFKTAIAVLKPHLTLSRSGG